ncbi:MAG: VOC family protein [Desulfovibrionaceae bacterium]|jgi:catechol 2,3-dioxygenase-like lactoylglutathione lyase family enzyme|nr:VOC family protein [Desulfovibrionaceae bacterium]
MITATRHTGIVVRDLERSLAFYRDMLGLKEWKRATEEGAFIETLVGLPGARLEWVKLKAPDGSLLELLQYHSHPLAEEDLVVADAPANRLGCSHVAFTVADAAAVHAAMTRAGLHCVSGPLASPDGAVRVLYCHDPDGVIVEIVEEVGA